MIRRWLLRPVLNRMERLVASVEDIKTKMAALVDAANKNADATQAVVGYVSGLKTQLADVQQQLADAIANQDPEALQGIADQLDAVTQSIDADAVAEAAITGSDAE